MSVQSAIITIQGVGLEGQGVGTDDARNIYFVKGAVPGDVVEVEFPTTAKRYRDAELIAVVTPSPERLKPPCPYFGECGGCDWQQFAYSAQLKAKSYSVAHVLERASLPASTLLPILEAGKPYFYRNRIQLRQEGRRIGFLKRGSGEIVDIEKCLIASEPINEALTQLRAESPPPNRRKIELVEENASVRRIYDSPHGAAGFTQVNPLQNEKLRSLVSDAIRHYKARRVLELFCGDGNLTQSYLPFVSEVVGVDSNGEAIRKAEIAFKAHTSAKFFEAYIGGETVRKLPPGFQGHYDTLVLDPPRAGAGPALNAFLHPTLKLIIYISCSPLTFSQDVKILVAQGYQLISVQPLDMFPQTRHLEVVGVLTRDS